MFDSVLLFHINVVVRLLCEAFKNCQIKQVEIKCNVSAKTTLQILINLRSLKENLPLTDTNR